MALTNFLGFTIPFEWLLIAAVFGVAFIGVLAYALFGKSGSQNTEITTEVWAYEPSGIAESLKVKEFSPTHIDFNYQEKDYSPKHTHPYMNVSRNLKVYMWPIGSDSCDDPERQHGKKDTDDPEPVIQETAHWMRGVRQAIGALGFSLKQNWFLVLIMCVAFTAIGYIVGNAYPLR